MQLLRVLSGNVSSAIEITLLFCYTKSLEFYARLEWNGLLSLSFRDDLPFRNILEKHIVIRIRSLGFLSGVIRMNPTMTDLS